MMMRLAGALVCCLAAASALAYPLDGYNRTGISRLEYYRGVLTGEVSGRPVPQGARLPLAVVEPRLVVRNIEVSFQAPDAELSKAIADALGAEAPLYGVTVLDLSDPARPVYAEHNGGVRRNVGSVGKLLVGIAWFQALADIYPNDIGARERLLRNTWISADEFIISDHHKVMFYDTETGKKTSRRIQLGDRGNLWDWLDWMLSASNNSAAATVQKQLILLKAFGRDYPPTPAQEQAFLSNSPRSKLGELFLGAMVDSVARNGINTELFRQGSFFTREGKRRVPGTSSTGNPREILKLLYRLERGEIVDHWSSREFKRLLYMTQRRIRYASHPVLHDYAVYFKSGSFYRCKPEPGFVCRQYEGNDLNLLASVAIIEGPVSEPRYHYLVAVSSNVLRKNSAVAHQTLALRIHRLIEARHAGKPLQANEHPWLPFSGVPLIGDTTSGAQRVPDQPSGSN